MAFFNKDWGQELKAVRRYLVMLARYASQDIDKISHWPLRKVREYVRTLSDQMEHEGGVPSSMSGSTGHPRP